MTKAPRGPLTARAVRSAAAVAVVTVALQAALAISGAVASTPPIARACRSIDVGGRALAVDITERRGGQGRCATGRAVMRRFVRTEPVYAGPNSSEVRFRGRVYQCYASRPDGEGWDYHCNWFADHGGAYVDYGAGRRF